MQKVVVDVTKRPVKRRPKSVWMANPLHKFRDPKEKIAAPDYIERVKPDYQAAEDLPIKSPKCTRHWRAIALALERAVKKGSQKKPFNQAKTSNF